MTLPVQYWSDSAKMAGFNPTKKDQHDNEEGADQKDRREAQEHAYGADMHTPDRTPAQAVYRCWRGALAQALDG